MSAVKLGRRASINTMNSHPSLLLSISATLKTSFVPVHQGSAAALDLTDINGQTCTGLIYSPGFDNFEAQGVFYYYDMSILRSKGSMAEMLYDSVMDKLTITFFSNHTAAALFISTSLSERIPSFHRSAAFTWQVSLRQRNLYILQ